MRNDIHATHRIIISTVFTITSLALFFSFPTSLFFDDVVTFITFIFILPLLFMGIVLHEPIKKHFSLPADILSQLGIGAMIGAVLGFLMGAFIASTGFAPQYTVEIVPFGNNFLAFLLYEFLFVLPSVLGSVFFGCFFVRHIYEPHSAAWMIGGIVTALLFIISSGVFLLILFPLIIIATLHYLKKDHFYTVTTALFFAMLIFDTIIIKSLI